MTRGGRAQRCWIW